MKNLRPLILLPLLAAFAASPVLAKEKHGRGNDDHDRHEHRDDHPGNRGHDNGRHLGWYKQQWRRGDRIEVVYIEPQYYVSDYRIYRLSPPPPGYRWVRPMDDRYLLVEVATGVILEALGY